MTTPSAVTQAMTYWQLAMAADSGAPGRPPHFPAPLQLCHRMRRRA
eukprot:COSAG04_NODE_7545_length_1110_cov_1.363996_1_plen_45_part_10